MHLQLLLLLSLYPSFYSAARPHDPHTFCTKRELARRDCNLKLRPFEVQLSKMKVTWSDGTWTSIADAPLPGDGNQWEKASLGKIGKRWILQMWIWDVGKGEAKVQSLHWVVAEMDEHISHIRVNEIVRKRKVKMTTPVTYSYDPFVKHNLKLTGNVIHWTVGGKSSTF